MGILITILTVLLVIDCVLLIGIILLQRGRGHGLAGAFGVGGMEEALGSHAATTAQKITIVLAVGFLVLSVVLGLLRRRYDADFAGPEPTPAGQTESAETDKEAPKGAPAGSSSKPATPDAAEESKK